MRAPGGRRPAVRADLQPVDGDVGPRRAGQRLLYWTFFK